MNRRIFLFTILFVLTGIMMYGWNRYQNFCAPENMRMQVDQMLAAALPGAKITFREITGSPLQRVRVYDLAIRAPLNEFEDEEVLRLDCVTIVPDRSDLLQARWRLKRIILDHPTLRLTQLNDGSWVIDRWNIKRKNSLKLQHPCDIEMNGGRLEVKFANPMLMPVTLEDCNLKFHVYPPSRFTWEGEFKHRLLALRSEGECDLAKKMVRINGNNTIGVSKPDLLRLWKATNRPTPSFLDEATSLSMIVETNFLGSASWADSSPVFAGTVNGRIKSGTVVHPKLPYALNDFTGEFMCDQDRWHLSSLECSLGPARLRTKAEGRFDRPGDVTANFGATGLPFSPEMLAVLPPQHQESWHKFSPEGAVDLHGWYRVFDGQPDTSVTVDFRNNAFTFFKFPYRCHSVSGRAVIRPTGECDVAVNGFAGEQPVQLVGRLDRLKPDAAYKFDLAVDNVPLDQRIDAALPDGPREVAQKFAGRGKANVKANFTRAEGTTEGTFHVETDLNFDNLQCEWFVYPMSDVTGTVVFEPERTTFKSIRGKNGNGAMLLNGSTVKTENGPVTDLAIQASSIKLDQRLKRALVGISNRWEETWQTVNPDGELDVACRLIKRGHDPVDLSVTMDLRKAAMKPRPFPYRLERFEGQFHHSGGVVQWDRCRVQHGATTIECSGEIKPTVAGGGTLILRDVRCDGLPFDHDLRQAMPKDFVPIFDFISPDRPIALHFDQFAVWWFDDKTRPAAVAFEGNFAFDRCRLMPSIGLQHATGRMRMGARIDGPDVRILGNVDLEQLRIAGFTAKQVTAQVYNSGNQMTVDNLQGNFYDGQLMGRVIASMGPRSEFDARFAVTRASLADYVKDVSRNPPKVDGNLDGDLRLLGKINRQVSLTGNGRIQVHDADVVRLPALQDMFRLISGQVPDGRTFDDIYCDFTFQDREMIIERMELKPTRISGPSLSLFNSGDGKLNLDTFAVDMEMAIRYAKGQLNIPVFTKFLNGVSDNVVKVQVGGSLFKPDVQVKPVPRFIDMIKRPRRDASQLQR